MSAVEPLAVRRRNASAVPIYRKPERFAMFLAGGFLLASLLLYVLTVSQESKLNTDQREIRRARETNVQLRAELAERESPSLIESRAKSLGLAQPKDVVYAPSEPLVLPATPKPPVRIELTEGY